MIVREFESREAWMNWRLGKITGSSLRETVNLREGGTKAGVWRTAAESIIGAAAIAEGELTAQQMMERGHELEPVAIRRFEEATGRNVRRGLIGWESEDDARMALSPDGMIGKAEAVEVKCLNSAKHLEAFVTRKIPKNTAGYEEQILQYFIVNKKLKKVHNVYYHPDFPANCDLFFITFTRKELQPEIDKILAAETDAVAKVREIVNAVTLYSPEEVAQMKQVREELLD